MSPARPLALLAALAVGAGALSGCGAEEIAGVDVAQAAKATASKGTARVTMTMKASGLGLPAGLELKATGVMALDEPKGAITFDLSDLLGIAGVVTGTDLEVRYDGADLYVDAPSIPGLDVPDGWMAVDLRAIAEALGIDPDAAGALFTLDPASQLEGFRAAGKLEEVGKERIDGAETTHYKGAYSINDTLDALPDDRRAALEETLDDLERLSPGAVDRDRETPVELWLDAASIVRRMQTSAAVPAQGGASAGTFDIVVELSDFGAPLDVSRPDDAEDVTDRIVELLRQGVAA